MTGSGLGLSIVRRIATLHGMSASFGNAPEGGFEAKSVGNCVIVAHIAKALHTFANFTAPLVGVKSSSNVFP